MQLTWTISRETKALVEGGRGGGGVLYGQVERQQPHFLLISSPSLYSHLHCTWFCVTSTSEFRLSHLDIHIHLHFSLPILLPLSTLLLSGFEWSHPLPSPSYLQSQQLLRPGQTETILPQKAQRTQVPEGQQSCTC